MAIYLTGDIHGNPERFGDQYMAEHYHLPPLTKDDIVIICGDFGLPWSEYMEPSEEFWLDWLEERQATFLFVDGNHENFSLLRDFPVKEWNGGRVHELRPNLLHLMRGEIFMIHGLKFLAFGGAYSIDRRYRVLNISWWKEEIPSEEEWENLRQNLRATGSKVDIVLTHTAPMRFLQPKTKEIGIHWSNFQDDVAKKLSKIEPEIQYQLWYFGHFHLDWVDREQKCRGIYTAIDVIAGKGNRDCDLCGKSGENSMRIK